MPPRIVHIRNRDAEGKVLARGGITLAISEDGAKVGIAVCSERDNYVKGVLGDGVRWAVARLWYIEGCRLEGFKFPGRVSQSVRAAIDHGQDYTDAALRCIGRHSTAWEHVESGVTFCYPQNMDPERWCLALSELARLKSTRTVAS